MKQRLLNLWLLAVMMIVGSSGAWGGEANTIFERGVSTAWSNADLTDWPTTAASGITSSINNGLVITVNAGNGSPAGNTGSFVKTIAPETSTSILTYTIVWNPGNATGKNNSSNGYVEFGDVKFLNYGQNQVAHAIIGGTDVALDGVGGRNIDVTVVCTVNQATKEVSYTYTAKGKTVNGTGVTNAAGSFTSFALGYGGTVPNWSNTVTLKSIEIKEEKQDVVPADYTVKYVCNNTEIKDAKVRTGIVGYAITLTEDDKKAYYINDKKYIYVSDDAASKTVAADGSTVITVTFREAATYTYSVTASDGTSTLANLGSGSFFEGDNAAVFWKKYIFVDGNWYVTAAPYGEVFTATTNKTVTYQQTNDIYYFFETDQLSFSRNYGSLSNDTKCSNGTAIGLYGGAIVTTPAIETGGYYTMALAAIQRNSGKTQNLSVQVMCQDTEYGNAIDFSHSSATGEYQLSNIYIPDGGSLKLTDLTNNNNNTYYDYIRLIRTGEIPMDKGAWVADTIVSATQSFIGDSITLTMTGAAIAEEGGAKYLYFAEGGTLTLTSKKEFYGFEKVVLNATKLNGSNAIWTGNAKEVTFTFTGETKINSLVIGKDGMLTELPTAATIADFKATTAETRLTLSNAEVLEVNAEEEYTLVQDATGGLKLKGIVLDVAEGAKLSGTLAGIYADNAELVSGTQTDYTSPKANGFGTTATEMTAAEAKTADNVYRLVTLKGVTISNDGTTITATDKTGTITVDAGRLGLANGDVLASLTGVTYADGTLKATAAQSGLLWKADDLTAGQALPISMTTAAYTDKLADVATGDAIVIETLGAGIIDVQDAAGQSIVKYELTQDENTLHFPVTADVVSYIQNHGLQLVGTGVKGVMAYKVPGLYSDKMTDNTVWYSDEDLAANYTVTLGAIHFTDVREGDELAGTVLTAAAAAAQQDKTFDATGKAQVDLVKKAVRDDKAEAKEGEEFTQDGYQSTNGMVMNFGGLTAANAYSFKEAYPAVNKFNAVTEGLDQFPVDDNDKAYDPAQKNVPTKGTFYVFNPTKDGVIDVTIDLEKDKQLYVTEDGEALEDFNGITKVTNNMISFPVKAGKTYLVFANESNLTYYGFTFTPTDATAQDLAKNIAIFKKLDNVKAKLMLNDAVVTYISGDNVFVEDESGAIDFSETRMQFYAGQKLNGYIFGQNVKDLPLLLRTAETPNSKFTAEKGTALSKTITVAEAQRLESLFRFVTLRNLKFTKDNMGFRILIDEAGDTIYVEDRFNVFYELSDKVKHIEGIIGFNEEGASYIWPTSKDGVVGDLPMEQLADGKYLLRNVASGLYLGAANNWGTRATLMNYSEYVTLKAIDAETYTIESQVSNGGTSYYFNGSYMDGAATNVTLAKDGKYYTIKVNDKFIGYSTKEPAYVTGMYALELEADGESREALWEIIPATADALKDATMTNPVDATFMVLNPNFGRNNRNTSAWTIAASNQNLSGGTNENRCAESYHSPFTLNQTITGLPIGTYQLTAQGFYRQDGSDNENLPYFYANDQKQTFPVKTGSENSMNDASASFATGSYTIAPITVTIVDGILNIGAKNENDALWCIWDNFQLKYCGRANVTIDMFVDAYDTALAAANLLVGEKMSKKTQDQLNEAIAAEVDKTSEESLTAATKALNDAIAAANNSIESYMVLATGTLPDNDLTGWTCTNSNTFHINTWSVEGNEGNDPSGMVTPFIENWVGKPGPLGEGKIFYTLKDINPSEVKVTALVRIYSESGEEPQGASFFVGNKKVDIATVGTSFEYNGMKGIYGTIEATGTTVNGNLVFGVELASPTFNWVAIKNVTIVATEKDDIPTKTLNFTPEYWNNTNVQMELGTTEVAQAWDTNVKEELPLYDVTMPEEFSGSLALQAVKDWADETKGWWLRSAAGGLYSYGARRPAAVTNLKAGNYVVFTCTRDASGVITLLNGEGQPDGPYTFEKDAQGRYCCTMTANGNLGFCGVMNVGYIKTIDIYNAKPVVTGIENVQSRLSGTEAIYNLRGQKVTGTLKPGLYIKNGKKIIVK